MVRPVAKSSGKISSILERQMRGWERDKELEPKITSKQPSCGRVKFYITISRESGCVADQVAQELVRRTGFEKFDREILDYMVKRDDVRRRLYETLDGRTLGWIEGILSGLSFGPTVDEEGYFLKLSHAVLTICHHTNAIIMGRGANFILPPECGLAVRLVAPYNYRLKAFAQQHKLDLDAAKAQMEKIDRYRGQFIENHFGKYAFDPRRYDLTINVSQFSPEAVADMIINAVEAKTGDKLKLPVCTAAVK